MADNKRSTTTAMDVALGLIVALLSACILLAAPFILLAYLMAGQFSSGEASQFVLLRFLAGLAQAFADVLLVSSLGAGAIVVLILVLWKAARSDPGKD